MQLNDRISGKIVLLFLMITIFNLSATQCKIFAEETSEQLIERKAQVEGEIDKLTNELANLQQHLDEAIIRFEQTKQEIVQNENDTIQIEAKISERGQIMEERLKVYQTNKSNLTIYIEALFRAETISDILGRVLSVNTILKADQNMLEEYKQDQKKLVELKHRLLILKEELGHQFKQLQQQESNMQLQKLELEANVLKLQEEIAETEERERLEMERTLIEQLLGDLQMLNGEIIFETVENPPAQDENIVQGVEQAKEYIGMPYVWGGMHPSTSFDCSGLIQWSYGQVGIPIPRTAAQQFLASVKIDVKDVLPGDLVFYSYGKGIQHVGIYVGDGLMLNSQNAGVIIEKISGWKQHFVGFGRIIEQNKNAASE